MAWAALVPSTTFPWAVSGNTKRVVATVKCCLQTPPIPIPMRVRSFCMRGGINVLSHNNSRPRVTTSCCRKTQDHIVIVPTERFSREAMHVLHRAQEVSKQLGHNFVGPEMILLALLDGDRDDNGHCTDIATKVFHVMDTYYGSALDEVESIIGPGSGSGSGSVVDISPGRKITEPDHINEIPYTASAQTVILRSLDEAQRDDPKNRISTEHMLLALVHQDRCVVTRVLRALGAYPNNIRKEVMRMVDDKRSKRKAKYEQLSESFTREYGTNLTKLIINNEFWKGKLHPIVGMQPQIERVYYILKRHAKNNPCLVGEHGVGKTSTALGLAQKYRRLLYDHHDIELISLDMGLLVCGEFEDRVKKITEELKRAKRNTFLFIDDIHCLNVRAAPNEGAIPCINILKQALARGELQCIGATTPDMYRKYIHNDPLLERLFQPVKVLEPTVDETVRILMGIQTWYEVKHGIEYTHEALVAAAQLSHKYISDRTLPGKAIDLIDEAGARVGVKHKIAQAHGLDDDLEKELKELKEQCKPPTELVEAELDHMKEIRSRKKVEINNPDDPNFDTDYEYGVVVFDPDFEKAGILRDLEIEHKVHIWTLEERIQETKKTWVHVTKADIEDTISSWDFHS